MIRYLLRIIALFIVCLTIGQPCLAQIRDEGINVEPEPYHESALRRFETIFAISLPFTSLHSYLAVRGVEMARQGKISPALSGTHWKAVGGLAILFSGCVAFWDYLHTRDEDIKDMSVPRKQTEIPDTGYMYRSAAEEPVLALLSVRF